MKQSERRWNARDEWFSALEAIPLRPIILNANIRHCRVCKGASRIDFYPSTGRWVDKSTTRAGTGLPALLIYLDD